MGQLAVQYYKENYDLVLIDKNNSDHENFYKVDIANYDELNKIIKKEKPNIILHFAAEIFDTLNKQKIYKTNVLGSLNVYKSAVINNVKNFIFTSTFSLFEKNYDNLITEIEPASCKNYYGITKAETERFLLSSNSEINISIFRCPVIVEKSRVHRLGVLFEFLKDDCTLWILGDGKNRIQFVSASDLFDAIDKSLFIKGKNVYNIGCDKVETMRETFEFLINKTGSKSKIRYFNKSFGIYLLKLLSFFKMINFIDYHHKILVSNVVLDITRIKNELNFLPKKSTAELLLEAHNYYIKNTNNRQKGSAINPRMGFFRVIKFFSRLI